MSENENITSVQSSSREVASTPYTEEAANSTSRAVNNNREKQNNSFESSEDDIYVRTSELSQLTKVLAEKLAQDDKNSVTVESFSKVVPDFDGVSIPVNQWLRSFEENADAYELSGRQKYVNARNKMIGTAKLFLETTTVYDYESLCAVLREEFEQKLNSAEVIVANLVL